MSEDAYRDDERSHDSENDEDDDWDPRIRMFKCIEADQHDVKGDQYKFTDRSDEIKIALQAGNGRNTFLHDLIMFDPRNYNLPKRSRKVDILKKKYRSLFENVLEYDKDLLLAKDDEGKTALYVAVTEGKLAFVELICEIGSSGEYSLQESISMPSDTNTNCIHKAISTTKFLNSAQKTQCLMLLLRYCKPKTLLLGDQNNNTPLHLIMADNNLKSFDTTQSVESMVADLVEICDAALKVSNKDGLTPFQFFILKCKKPFYDRGSEAKLSKDPDPKGPTPSTRTQEMKPIVSRDLPRQNTGPNRTPVSPIARTTFSEQTVPGKQIPNRGLQRSTEPVARSRVTPQVLSATQVARHKGWDDSEFKKILIWIETHLKKAILRKFDLGSASIALYGNFAGKRNGPKEDERKQLAFNLIGAARSLSAKTIGQYYDFLKFDSMLQFVALPQPPPKQTPSSQVKSPLKHDKDDKADDTKKTHYPEIFGWLKNRADGKVKQILRIIIEDDLNDPHSDEEIEETLSGIDGIEDWKWRKYDISSSTIFKAAKDVKKLHLYTTGNNAVLEGWLASDGLRRLKQLEEVTLWVKQPQSAKSNDNIEAFKTRLQASIKDDCREKSIGRDELTAIVTTIEDNPIKIDQLIKTIKTEAHSSPVSARGEKFKITSEKLPKTDMTLNQEISQVFGPGDRGAVHRWLESVRKCRDWIRNVREEIGMENKRIKVALIDDGVDASHGRLSDNIHHGISFVAPQPGQHNVPSSYYASSSGHGTLMASLITFACPWVELYVAKMNDGNVKNKRAFTATSAAEAVKWATEQDVDIISMSWTIDKDESISNALNSLDDALSEADKKNILMFCAARDEGIEKATDQAYPAGSRIAKQIFRIGAAAASGVGSTWVNLPAIDYLFPGADLREFWQYSKLPHMPAVDGSSSATALASGLTALILSILAMDTTGKWDKTRRSHSRIKSILDSARGEKTYLQVWQLWTDSTIKDDDEVDVKIKARLLQDMVTLLINKSS